MSRRVACLDLAAWRSTGRRGAPLSSQGARMLARRRSASNPERALFVQASALLSEFEGSGESGRAPKETPRDRGGRKGGATARARGGRGREGGCYGASQCDVKPRASVCWGAVGRREDPSSDLGSDAYSATPGRAHRPRGARIECSRRFRTANPRAHPVLSRRAASPPLTPAAHASLSSAGAASLRPAANRCRSARIGWRARFPAHRAPRAAAGDPSRAAPRRCPTGNHTVHQFVQLGRRWRVRRRRRR